MIKPPGSGSDDPPADPTHPLYQPDSGLITEHSSIAIFVIDDQHRLSHWNRACETLTGLSAQAMLGTREQWRAFYRSPRPVLADLIVEGASEATLLSHYGEHKGRPSRILEGAYEAESFFPEVGPEGRWLYFTAAPLYDDGGRLLGSVETLQDITGRKHAEAELVRHHAQLEAQVASRTAELVNANERLTRQMKLLRMANRTIAAANEELDQYAYVVSHDLRAPLRAVRNYADFLTQDLAGRLEPEQARYLSGIQQAMDQGEHLVDDLLQLSRVGPSQKRLKQVDLGGLLRRLVTSLNLSGTVVMVPGWPQLHSDPLLLMQIFQNLLTNGVKFNRAPQPRVELHWRHLDADRIEVNVRDNGIGIEPEHHQSIFRLFRRLHTRDEFAGTGIGLAIAKKSLECLGGGIQLDPQVDQGASFRVELPLDSGAAWRLDHE